MKDKGKWIQAKMSRVNKLCRSMQGFVGENMTFLGGTKENIRK